MDTNVISKAIVVDLIDKQNNANGKRVFSSQVEPAMRSLNFHKEANFCKVIREWYQAEDMPGLSAVDRCKRRLALKNFLLDRVDFGEYPQPGMYVIGFPKVMFESFLQWIDTSFQLYSSLKGRSYNPRAMFSLVNETFFGEFSEPTRLGCPKAISIPRLISTVTEIQHFRSDPTVRTLKIITTRKSVYPATELHVTDFPSTSTTSECTFDGSALVVRDHAFDLPTRRRKKQRKSKRSDVSKPFAVARGCQPIRSHHKCDESKQLPTRRLGIEME